MDRRRITVTVDEELVDAIRRHGEQSLSKVVNDALRAHAERLRRRAALPEILDGWDGLRGRVREASIAEAEAGSDRDDVIPDA